MILMSIYKPVNTQTGIPLPKFLNILYLGESVVTAIARAAVPVCEPNKTLLAIFNLNDGIA